MYQHVSIKQLLFNMGQYGASDLHLKVGLPPTFRIGGELKPLGLPPLTADDTKRMVAEIMPAELTERYEKQGDIDFSTYLDTRAIAAKSKALKGEQAPDSEKTTEEEGGVDRFRCNVFRAEGGSHAAIRRINPKIPSFDSLGLPDIYRKLAEETHDGLILVVGVTGSGKSTTLACMLERVNETQACNIITVEDPIEFHFTPKKSVISQREIGIDVPSYASALRFIVRQDPDVIFIGELRDHDTVQAALQAAETGHLVFGSMHTADTTQSFSRLLEFFPQVEHDFIRSSLAASLRAVCAQRLLPAQASHSVPVAPATEVLLNNAIVRELIRDGEDEDLPAALNAGAGDGMRSYTDSLAEMVEKEIVSLQTAMEYAPNREALSSRLKGVQVRSQGLVKRVGGRGT
jgi:twitching motility protein PilT